MKYISVFENNGEPQGITAVIKKLFESRTITHAAHLNTLSKSEHIDLQDYYEGILDIADELAEVYQGQFGLIDMSVIQSMDQNIKTGDIAEYLETVADTVTEGREAVDDKSLHLNAILDDAMILIYKTLYKIKNLK